MVVSWSRASQEHHGGIRAGLNGKSRDVDRREVERDCISYTGTSGLKLDGGEFETRDTSVRLAKSFYTTSNVVLPSDTFHGNTSHTSAARFFSLFSGATISV